MFSTLGGTRKKEPIITFKRKIPFVTDEPLRKSLQQVGDQHYDDFLIPTLEETCPKSNSNLSLEKSLTTLSFAKSSTVQKKVPNEKTNKTSLETTDQTTKSQTPRRSIVDSIFDFPDLNEEHSEIKVMVASSRPVLDTTPLVRKKSKSRNKSPGKPSLAEKIPVTSKKSLSTPTNNVQIKSRSTKTSNYDAFDIFDFDPVPTSQPLHRKARNIPNTTTPNRNTANFKVLSVNNSIYPINKTGIRNQASIDNTLCNEALFQANNSSLINTPLPEKKRKRNLVAHLKTANGETETKPQHQGFDFLSDEEEFLLEQQQQQPLSPVREIITTRERSFSPELSYAERMELQLDSIMRSEFGDGQQQSKKQVKSDESNTRRPRYQPLNKVNVKVTF